MRDTITQVVVDLRNGDAALDNDDRQHRETSHRQDTGDAGITTSCPSVGHGSVDGENRSDVA